MQGFIGVIMAVHNIVYTYTYIIIQRYYDAYTMYLVSNGNNMTWGINNTAYKKRVVPV